MPQANSKVRAIARFLRTLSRARAVDAVGRAWACGEHESVRETT